MEIWKRVKALIDGQDRKKLIENTVIVIIVGIIILIAGSSLFRGKPSDTGQSGETPKKTAAPGETTVPPGTSTEERLKSLLSQMKGVGRVDVMVSFAGSSENIPAYDTKKNRSTTQEKDKEGGTRSITQEENDNSLVYEDSGDGGKKPVILKKIEPEVKGVLVVAEGAESAEVRERICDSVMVLLDVPAHKVQVVPRKK